MYAAFNELDRVELTLYTDALITHGTIRTRQRRVTDILNLSEEPFVVLEDVLVEELGTRGEPIRAGYAQVNIDAVLFAVANEPVRDSLSSGRPRPRSRRSSRSRRSRSWARSTSCRRAGTCARPWRS